MTKKVPGGHAEQLTKLDAYPTWQGRHAVELVAPWLGLAVSSGHARHLADESAPREGPKVPGGQGTHAVEPGVS